MFGILPWTLGNGVEPHVNGVLEVWRRRDLRTLFISGTFPPAACHDTVSHYHNQHTTVWTRPCISTAQ